MIQREIFDGWKRPVELLTAMGNLGDELEAKPTPTMLPSEPMDLVQDVTTDCSVVASLCSGARPSKNGYSKVCGTVVKVKHQLSVLTSRNLVDPHHTDVSPRRANLRSETVAVWKIRFSDAFQRLLQKGCD
jgi:hypothetical protein